MVPASCSLPSIPSSSFFLPKPPNPTAKKRRPPPISISSDRSHLDLLHLRDLFLAANHSCHRFPALAADGRPEPVDLVKLRRAVSHSYAVVSVFCRARFLAFAEHPGGVPVFGLGSLFERETEMEKEWRLVGFGRAVSDEGLTASIHDIVVIPLLRRLGIGRKIVYRLIRILSNKGIYDISALCSENDRLFFKSCGFGEDSLGSTTMMYTQTATNYSNDDMMVTPAGRLLLLVPPARKPTTTKRIDIEVDNPLEVENKAL